MMLIQTTSFHYFNPQGSREPRRLVPSLQVCGPYISIHKALASLDVGLDAGDIDISRFQSTRLSRASTKTTFNPLYDITISIHKALANLDDLKKLFLLLSGISIHKALASLDRRVLNDDRSHRDFNPQGSREPRRGTEGTVCLGKTISIHKALASLDFKGLRFDKTAEISIHKALASLDSIGLLYRVKHRISIHKALASLDPEWHQPGRSNGISIHKALASLDPLAQQSMEQQL